MENEKNTLVLEKKVSRRDFIVLSATSIAGVGAAVAAWPLIDSMNPAADVLALSSVEVDLAPVETGQTIKVMWRGKPLFIRHRTEQEILEAEDINWRKLPDPQSDAERVQKKQWLIMIGVCTHLGCIPIGNSGDYGGWFCPCHGSHYDTSGRIRRGPAPANLVVPEYKFITDTKIKVG